jgi:hypothetical protein
MILTIKNADFSAANIGTLSSYVVSKTIGAGAAFDIPSTVDKNSSINWVITLDEGYTFGTYAVTMNGEDIIPTVVDNVMTISIAEVTGNVRIVVATVNENIGEEDEPVVPPVEPDEPVTQVTTIYFTDANAGYLRGGKFVEAAAGTAGTTDYIDISNMPKIGYYGRMGYVAGDTFHALEFYDADKNYIDSLSVNGNGQAVYINIDLSSDSKYAAATYVRASVSRSSFSVEQFNSWRFVVGDFVQEEKQGLELLEEMFPIKAYIGLDGKNIEADSGAYTTYLLDIVGKTTLEYSGRMGTIGLNYAFYDENKKFIPGLELVGDGNFKTITIDLTDSKYANAKYVAMSISKGKLTDEEFYESSCKIS